MKIAVSIPDDVFIEAERVADELQMTRSGFYCRALREFLERQADDRTTSRMNAAIDALGQPSDPFVLEAGRRIIAHTEW